jgi:serine protease Do
MSDRPELDLPPRPEPVHLHVGGPRLLPAFLLILLVLLAGLVAPIVVENVQYAITRGRQRAEADVAREQLGAQPDATNIYTNVAKVIGPSVVGIEVVQGAGAGEEAVDEMSGLYGGRVAVTGGSGVIIDASGDVITNFHVVANARAINVQLSEGRVVDEVEFVGADRLSDVAVLRIKAKGLVPAAWGDSEKLQVGDQVLAIGSPYGLSSTVTAGIISAKNRSGVMSNSMYQDFLQTDAAVNPGNSGGPLVNLRGEVVGINTAIFGDRYQGISFAIPSQIVRKVYDEIKQKGQIVRGWLGVSLEELTPQLSRRLGVGDTRGAVVTQVMADSPATQAGLEPGDVIVAWGGKPVRDVDSLRAMIAYTSVGQSVKVKIIRQGRAMEVSVSIGQKPTRFRLRP